MYHRLKHEEKGITLLEILLALVIGGIMVSLMLRLYIDQYRLASEVMSKAESRFAVYRAGQVLTSAISKAEKVIWVDGTVLKVEYLRGDELITDYYFVDDKDSDGHADLYRKHLGVSNPIVTGISVMNIGECGEGLWEIRLESGQENQASFWENKVRQRLCRP